MDRTIVIAGATLVAMGTAVFLWKVLGLGLPVLPSEEGGVWKVQLDVAVRGLGEDGSVRAALPDDGPRQRIFGEHFSSHGLHLAIRTDEVGQRQAVWSGRIEDVERVSYRFNAQLFRPDSDLRAVPEERPAAAREGVGSTRPAAGLPADAPQVSRLLEQLDLDENPGERVRAVFAFVRHEVSGARAGSDDALLTLAQRAGSALGRERLLVTLLRGSGVPASIEQGLELRQNEPRVCLWTEALIEGRWVPLSASSGFFGSLPENIVTLATGGEALVQGTGTRAVAWELSAMRERLTANELASLMLPPSETLRTLSFYRLPVPVQEGLRILLLFCAATLIVSFLRVMVGVPSYGTFMPALLALAMRETGLASGLVLVLLVIAVGLAGRLVLDRLRLLFVPRLSILVCTVVLAAALLGLVGRSIESGGLYGGMLLPIVIVTMMIERFAIVLAEEGGKEALVRALGSTLIAVAAFPVLRSETLGHLLFAFPELVLVVIGLQIWLGGYTGYRLVELARFWALRRAPEAA